MSAGDPVEATVSWQDLDAGQAYLGLVEHGDGTRTVGTTPLTVTPQPRARAAVRARLVPPGTGPVR
ncbi:MULTISPECIES: hypothetical protein [Streptomyces]|uniref:Uncharacterized protein n=1 Tax=Streptomyces bottropensis ATCC 25435 TaxID=1054862 RepID=M3F6Z2_9ACTN|nr:MULTISPECIES: hypothetical protein [Streptomyces]EMF57393.1 hypothetical protein SBD_0065 [Streptomyces bottropensis ATCC 25435]MZD17965.1 hypothetical protein [Streptomyces sp. SID5476]